MFFQTGDDNKFKISNNSKNRQNSFFFSLFVFEYWASLRYAGGASGRKIGSAEELCTRSLREGASGRCFTNVEFKILFAWFLQFSRTI